MAGQDRTALDPLSFLAALERDPGAFDFHVALRRIECLYRDRPRLGTALRPSDEPLRIGQEPSTTFVPSALTAFQRADDGNPGRLEVAFTGMFGTQGPLPLHLTEYARDRMRKEGDRTFTSFVNLLQHRMLLLFHRAWVQANAVASRDRLEADRFEAYVGTLLGVALGPQPTPRMAFDQARLYYAGRLALRVRNPEGVVAVIADYLGLPVALEEFVGEWVDLPDASRWRLGEGRHVSTLGHSTILGARVFRRDHKFRVVLGPLGRDDFEQMLPGSDGLARLRHIVRTCVGDELKWDVRLIREPAASDEVRLGRHGRLGWTTRLGAPAEGSGRTDLIVDPFTLHTVRMPWQPIQHRATARS